MFYNVIWNMTNSIRAPNLFSIFMISTKKNLNAIFYRNELFRIVRKHWNKHILQVFPNFRSKLSEVWYNELIWMSMNSSNLALGNIFHTYIIDWNSLYHLLSNLLRFIYRFIFSRVIKFVLAFSYNRTLDFLI